MILTIGVMTGNSLDAADAVLTSFDGAKIKDVCSFTVNFPQKLREDLLGVRRLVFENKADMATVSRNPFFVKTVKEYTELVAQSVNGLVEKSGIPKSDIAAIGFHGQTCDHFPPSVAKGEDPYTLQIGDPELLAELTGMPVIFDFRSDDIMNGGEGAPLAPVHNAHIAVDLKEKGLFPAAFCNGGNTGNISVISIRNGETAVSGWDTGPFNHFPDYMMRLVRKEPYDADGFYGSLGNVMPDLLAELFEKAAVTRDGGNFYLQPPPKSSDPSWYRLPDAWREYAFENALRTAEYLSAYGFFYTLSFVGEDVEMPTAFLLFGGGWKNPLIRGDFQNLLQGRGFVLPEHKEVFEKIRSRFSKTPVVQESGVTGYDGTYMEARIFADMAYCRIVGEPFTFPQGTGCSRPTVAGIIAFPETGGDLLKRLLKERGTQTIKGQKLTQNVPKLYNRAAKGWQKKLNQ